MQETAKGPAERIISTLTEYIDHAVHNRPGAVFKDARHSTGVRWAPVTHAIENNEAVVYQVDKPKGAKKSTKTRLGILGKDQVIREGGREVARYQPAGFFQEVVTYIYQQVADVWQLDNEFAAHWASYAFDQDHRDMKVILAAFMMVQSRKGDPVRDAGKIVFHDSDYRDVGEAMALIFSKNKKGFDAKMLLRIHDILTIPGVIAINRKLGFGQSLRNPPLGRWPKVVTKWLQYREQNLPVFKGLIAGGSRKMVKQLAIHVGYKPSSPVFFELLRWKQAQAKAGHREMAIGAELAAAESWEGLTEKQICERILETKPSYKRLGSLVPTKIGITRAIMAAAIESGALSDKDLVIATPTLEDLGLLQVTDIKSRWESAIKASEDMRAANIARNVRSTEVKEKLQEAAEIATKKAVEEDMKHLNLFVVVDISSSMSEAITKAKECLVKLLPAFPLERLHVSTFNTASREIKIPHASAAGVENAFSGVHAGGGTDYGSGVRSLLKYMSRTEDNLWIFVGDEGDPNTFNRSFANCDVKPVAFGLLRVQASRPEWNNGTVVRETARVMGIPCLPIDEKIFADPYAIPRTIRNLIASTPVGVRVQVQAAPARVTLVDKILQTPLLAKPAWAVAA